MATGFGTFILVQCDFLESISSHRRPTTGLPRLVTATVPSSDSNSYSMSERPNRKDRRAEARKVTRNQKDIINSKSAHGRKKERLERQRDAQDTNRKRAMTAFGVELPPEPEAIDALLNFTFNKREIGYGWVAIAVVLLVLAGDVAGMGLREGMTLANAR